MNDTRRAALTLHALPEADRQWVLQRLEPMLQQTLQGHLEELAELGIPSDPSLIKQALSEAAARDGDWRRRLDGRDAALVHELLADEPAGVLARVLQAGPWSWESALLSQVPAHRRSTAEQARRALPPESVELNEWLAQRLERRCAERLAVLEAPGGVLAALPHLAGHEVRR